MEDMSDFKRDLRKTKDAIYMIADEAHQSRLQEKQFMLMQLLPRDSPEFKRMMEQLLAKGDEGNTAVAASTERSGRT